MMLILENDRADDEYIAEKDGRVVGNKFLPLHRLYKCPEYNYSKNKLDNSFLKQNFVKILTTHLDHNSKDAGYFIRVSIRSFKKSFLKHICNDDCNWTQTHNHLVYKRTVNHLAKLAK